MKMVLVAGFNPRLQKNGPKVKLAAGWYRLCVENHIDSELVLHIGPFGRIVPIKCNGEFNVYDGEFVALSLLNGTEDYLNVFAESINEPVPTKLAG